MTGCCWGSCWHEPLPGCWQTSRLAHSLLGCLGVNGTDGAGIWRGLPQMKSETHLNYPQLLVPFSACLSAIKFCAPARCWAPDLCQLQHSLDLNGLFACRSPFNYSDGVIGLFGLAGVAGGWALVRRAVLPIRVNRTTPQFRSAAAVTFMAGDLVWSHFRLALIIGILVLDLTVQGVHIITRR